METLKSCNRSGLLWILSTTMASTPSASALSAVLRCRGNIWSRNPPTKRPASLGMTGGSPVESSRANQASTWEAFLQGDLHVVVGRRLTVAYKSARVDGAMLRGKDAREINKLCHKQLSQSAGDARSAVRNGVRNALVRQLARRLISSNNLLLPGTDRYSQMIHKIKYETHMCKIVFIQESSSELPADVLKVSITSRTLMEHAGQLPSFVLTGWTTLRSTCLSLTALVSEFMCLKLAVLWMSSSRPDDEDGDDDVLQHQNIRNNTLQANGRTHCPTDLTSSMDYSNSGQMIPEDRPD